MKGVYLNFLDPKTRNERLTKDWNCNLEFKKSKYRWKSLSESQCRLRYVGKELWHCGSDVKNCRKMKWNCTSTFPGVSFGQFAE